jgi:hypothetical protein
MARTAISELQQQIEEVRREAFAAGYAAAMQTVRELASHPAPGAETVATAAPRRRRAGRKAQATAPNRRRQSVRSNVPQDPADRLLAGRSGAPMHKGSRRS